MNTQTVKRGRGRPPKNSAAAASPVRVAERADASGAPASDEAARLRRLQQTLEHLKQGNTPADAGVEAQDAASAPSDADVALGRAEAMLADLDAQVRELEAEIAEQSAAARALDDEAAAQQAEIAGKREQRQELGGRIQQARIALTIVAGTDAAAAAAARLSALEREHATVDAAISAFEAGRAEREGEFTASKAAIRDTLEGVSKRRAALLATRASVQAARSEAHARKVAEIRAACEQLVARTEAEAGAANLAALRRQIAARDARATAERVLGSYPETREEAKRYAAPPTPTPLAELIEAHEGLLQVYARVAGTISPDEPTSDPIPGHWGAREVLADVLALTAGDIRRLLTVTNEERADTSLYHTTAGRRFNDEKAAVLAALRQRRNLQPKNQLPLGSGLAR